MKRKSEYQAFEALLGTVASVPHSEIKEKLDAEKKAKKKLSKSRASKASVRASSGKG